MVTAFLEEGAVAPSSIAWAGFLYKLYELYKLDELLTPSRPSPRGRRKKGSGVGRLYAINMSPRWGLDSFFINLMNLRNLTN